MRTELLDYELPRELIAQEPAPNRERSRLLVLDRKTGRIEDRMFSDLPEYLQAGDGLVLNNTRVVAARFYARRKTGALIEGLWLREPEPGLWKVMLKNSRKVSEGETLTLLDRSQQPYIELEIQQRLEGGRWILRNHQNRPAESILQEVGFAPLPPYIKRKPDPATAGTDLERYQTVFAKENGAVAAPTAGLHFTNELFQTIQQKQVHVNCVTLHVGAGTFKPVTAEDLDDHEIHWETFEIDQAAATHLNQIKASGKRIIAVGTTTVRTLETVSKEGRLHPASGRTRLFIQPGYEFGCIDAMVTNFHLPRSTLLALVFAFAGRELVLEAYRHAIEKRYRFFSYGDAMLIQ